MPDTSIHVHFDTRRGADPAFHMTPQLVDAALARYPELQGRVKVTIGWDMEGMDEVLQTARMLVGWRMPKEAIRTSESLQVIHLIGAGVEHLRPLDWLPSSIMLTNNRGVHGRKAAESVLLATLMLNSYLPALMSAQRVGSWQPRFSTGVDGKTALVIGVGGVGGAGAAELQKMGMHVIGIRRSSAPHVHCDETYSIDKLHAVLPRADFVIVSTPVTAETEGFIGKDEFALMKKGAGFVNFARAHVCDYRALKQALDDGHLSGAVLDVFDPEPLIPSDPIWSQRNVICTPHCLLDDAEAYIPGTLNLVFENVSRLLRGEPLVNVVDRSKEY